MDGRCARAVWLAFVALVVAVGCDYGDPVDVPPGAVALDGGQPVAPQLARLVAHGAIPEADVNRDGVVDIRDLIIVAQSFGQPLDLPANPVDVLDVQLRVTQQNDLWWREAWRATLRNNTLDTVAVDVDVELQDADGFIVDTDFKFNIPRGPGAIDTVTGSALSDADWADAIVQAVASVRVDGWTPAGDDPSPGDIGVDELATRVTERNDLWWRFAWQLTLTNTTDRTLVFDATIDLQDADGFTVDTDFAFGLDLEPGETRTFGGSALVSSESAELIARYAATLR